LVEAQAHLESLGHEFIEIEIPSIEDQFQNHMKLMMNENLNLIAENWDERCDDLENVGNLLLLYRSSPMIANTISKIAKLFGQSRLADVVSVMAQVDNGTKPFFTHYRWLHRSLPETMLPHGNCPEDLH